MPQQLKRRVSSASPARAQEANARVLVELVDDNRPLYRRPLAGLVRSVVLRHLFAEPHARLVRCQLKLDTDGPRFANEVVATLLDVGDFVGCRSTR